MTTTSMGIVCAIGALLVSDCIDTTNAAPPAFSDQTVAAGVQTTHTGSGLYYGMLAGGAAGDFNNDGYQDLYVISGASTPDRLYINNGNGTFTDQAAAWGIDGLHRGASATVGDYNNDGFLDLFVTSFGPAASSPAPGMNRLYKNNAGASFTDVAALAGVNTSDADEPNGLGAVFGDYDLDGDLDLYVTGWFGLPNINEPESYFNDGNHLYQNNGDGTFTNVTAASGTASTETHGFTACFADMNGDRYPEIMICGDYETSAYLSNNTDGTFTDDAVLAGIVPDPATNAMGMTLGDINRDGLMDWYVSSINGNRLFINQGSHTYNEISQTAGVNLGGWGWGALMMDMNHDQHLDLLETNGWFDTGCNGCDAYPNHPSYLWMNNGDMTFTDTAAASGFAHTGQGRGMISLDYDNDGDQDVVILSWQEDLMLLRNDLAGPDTNWLRVFLDTSANDRLAPDGFGAKVVATTGGVTQSGIICGKGSYLSASEFSAHFGLGSSAVIDELLIEWPNGVVTTMNNVAINQTLTVVAGAPGDCNGDGAIDTADLGILIAAFGSSTLIADINGDGTVDTADLGQLIANFGT